METEGENSTDSGVKRRLLLTGGLDTDGLDDANNKDGDLMVTNRDPPLTGLPESIAENERKKRAKKAEAISPSLGSAGSREESVRSQ
jgi:hypothetical protein